MLDCETHIHLSLIVCVVTPCIERSFRRGWTNSWELLNVACRRCQLRIIGTHGSSGSDVFNSMFNAYHCSSSVLNLTHDRWRWRLPLRLLIRPWIFKKCYGSNVRCHSDILCYLEYFFMASWRCHSDVQYIAMASSGCHRVKSLVAIIQLSSTFPTEVWGVASYVAVGCGSWCISSTSVGTKRLTMACVQQNWLKLWEKLDKARQTNKATNIARVREPFPSLT